MRQINTLMKCSGGGVLMIHRLLECQLIRFRGGARGPNRLDVDHTAKCLKFAEKLRVGRQLLRVGNVRRQMTKQDAR